jgi:hypothetical protein
MTKHTIPIVVVVIVIARPALRNAVYDAKMPAYLTQYELAYTDINWKGATGIVKT